MLEQVHQPKKRPPIADSCREMIKMYSLSTEHLYKDKTSGHSSLSRVWNAAIYTVNFQTWCY